MLRAKANSAMNRLTPWFYGWNIVAMTFFIQFLVMGSGYYIFGVLLKPLSETLDASRFVVSLALTGQIIMSALLGPWLGRAVGERSIRGFMTTGILILAAGLTGVSFSETIWQFYVAFMLLVSVGFALAGPVPNSALIANWFSRKRGSAMGISQFGVTLSGALLIPLFTWLMLTFDWRIALRVFAIGVPTFALPLIWFGIVKTPREISLNPDGDATESEGSQDRVAGEEKEWTLRAAIRSKTVWRLALIMGPGFMGISAVLLSLHSHLTDSGLSAMRASSVIAAMTFAGAIAKPLFGILSDYLSKKWVTFASIVFMFLGVAGIITSSHFTLIMFSAASFGLGYGAQMPLFNILIGTLFGQRSFARMIGIMGPIMLPFNLIGLPMSTWSYESFGSYTPAYAFMLALYILAMISLATFKLTER